MMTSIRLGKREIISRRMITQQGPEKSLFESRNRIKERHIKLHELNEKAWPPHGSAKSSACPSGIA